MISTRIETDEQGIATLWLDTPGKRVNTLSRQMWADLSEAIDQIERENPAGLVITSAKPYSFVVGADLSEIRDLSDGDFDAYIATGQRILKRIDDLPMPVIAAINGDCVGGGLELALACDVRLAIESKERGDLAIRLPEVTLGLVPGWGATVRLPRLIGPRAIPILLDAPTMSAVEAKQQTIVEEVLKPDELLPIARRLASDIRARPLVAQKVQAGAILPLLQLRETKLGKSEHEMVQSRLIEVIRKGLMHGEEAGFDAERRTLLELRRSPYAKRKIQEFFDRRSQRKRSAGE